MTFPDTIAVPSGHGLAGLEARDVMTPGVVTIVEDASLVQVCRALAAHGVHAVLVVGRSQGVPLGWITARGLLGFLDRDIAFATAREAVVEPAVTIEPSAPLSAVVSTLAREQVSHVLVAHRADVLPEGVISDADLVRALGRGGR
jgi:CBS-domain-containing membrane protein